MKTIYTYFHYYLCKNYLVIGLFVASLSAALWLFSVDRKEGEFLKFSQIRDGEDLISVRKLLFEYEELNWLTRNEVDVTPENGINNPKSSYSFKLFGSNFPEFDRTVMSISCLNLFLDGKYEDYLEFVYLQSKGDRLEWKSFLDIQRNIRGVLDSLSLKDITELRQVLETSLILNNIIKTKIAKDLAKERGIVLEDFDEAYRMILLNAPDIFPSYQKLSLHGRDLFCKLSFQSCFGHIAHLEGGPELFTLLKKLDLFSQDSELFELELFLYQCNVGGALGHVDSHSSIAYNEQSHQIIEAIRDSCLLLKTHDENSVFERYLTKRGDWLGFDIASPLNRVLARIGSMLRLTKLEEGKMLKDSFLRLAPEDLSLIVDVFNVSKQSSKIKIPMHMPAVLVNLVNNEALGSEKQDRLLQSIHVGLPFIAKVLRSYKNELNQKILNFDEIAKLAREEPERLLKDDFTIDPNGHVLIKKMESGSNPNQ